jgi:site-specific recombinase XerD
MIRKTDDGKWRVDLQPGGRAGKRIKRIFKTLAEAKRFEAQIKGECVTKPWNPPAKDKRKLSELVEAWWKLHGQHLISGKNTKGRLLKVAAAVRDPRAEDFSARDFLKWRSEAITRTEDRLQAAGANRLLAYMKAMFEFLIQAGDWKKANPLEEVRQLPAPATELRSLTENEIIKILNELQQGRNPHAYPCAVLALATGARWSEAETITTDQMKIDQVHYHTRKDSRGGKWRHVPIAQEIHDLITDHHKIHKEETEDQLFLPCYSAFRDAIKRAGIKLPDGQLSHVLRHTFASTFLRCGGDLRTLQDLLGHKTITMTMRYAHLAQSQRDKARTLNPLANISVGILSEVKKKTA